MAIILGLIGIDSQLPTFRYEGGVISTLTTLPLNTLSKHDCVAYSRAASSLAIQTGA